MDPIVAYREAPSWVDRGSPLLREANHVAIFIDEHLRMTSQASKSVPAISPHIEVASKIAAHVVLLLPVTPHLRLVPRQLESIHVVAAHCSSQHTTVAGGSRESGRLLRHHSQSVDSASQGHTRCTSMQLQGDSVRCGASIPLQLS